MNYIAIIIIGFVLLSLAMIIGKKIAGFLGLIKELRYTALGLAFILAVLFVLYVPLVYFEMSALITNATFMIVLIIIAIYALFNIKELFDQDIKMTLINLGYVILFVYLSTKITLGEQTGDSNFYFTIVQRNINSDILGQFYGYNGGIFSEMVIGIQYAYQAFYQMFSAILWALRLVFDDIFLDHAIYMWLANIIFYYISFEAIINVYLLFRSKISFLINILFSGFFLGSLYYNLSLPHVGVIFMVALLTNLIIHLFGNYDKVQSKWLLIIYSFAMISCASTGLFISFFLAYAYIISKIINKEDKIIESIYLIALPIMIYGMIFIDNIIFSFACIVLELVLLSVRYLILYKKAWQNYIGNAIKALGVIIPLLFVLIGIFYIRPNDFSDYIMHFFIPHSSYDRVQDYFVFDNIFSITKNVLYYISILSLILIKKYRSFAMIIVIVFLTFANPFVMPFVIRFMTRIEVYQRTFYLLFNTGFVMLGFSVLYNFILEKGFIKNIVSVMLIIVYGFFSWSQLTGFYHIIYKPGDDFNPLYKVHQGQIDVLNALNYEIKVNRLVCPVVISQIDATIMLEPNITLINGVPQRHDPLKAYPNDPVLNELVNIFHSPIYDGDDGRRFNSDYMNLSLLLDQAKVDYVIVRKTLYVTNNENEWVPLYSYLFDSNKLIYEDDDYILFRHYH
ncbi:MAG: hypothetical protein PHN21_04555 [Erysipelotrichaceae bacterium]|nr:hypothetical protein [Erysipelotrichaceae bacterium]